MFRTLVVAITLGCAPTQSPRASAPPPVERPATAADLAERAKTELSLAEQQLDQLEPEAAAKHLDAARKALFDAKLDSHDEGPTLRARHKEIAARLPEARAEARRVGLTRAREKIDLARTNLDEAVAAIKRKDAGEEELNAAKAAVDALKTALDEGAKFESGDLAYTKYSLEGRRVYRTQRDFVEKRWVESAVANGRADIERVLADLKEALERLKSKDVMDEEFTHARNAIEQVQQALVRQQQLASKNVKFASYVAQVKTRIAAEKRAVDQRQIKVAVERQKVRVEDGRRVLAEALTAGQLDEAEVAIAATAKVLDEGKSLTAKDREYASYAVQVGKRLEEAKQKIDTRRLWIAVGQQKDQVKEALASMRQSLARLPAPEDVTAAEAHIEILEKTLQAGEQLAAQDPPYARYAADAKKAASDGRTRIQVRKDELMMEAQQAKVEAELENVKAAVSALDGFAGEPAAFTAAAEAVKNAEKAIASGAEVEKKLPRYASWANQARRTLEDSKQRIEKRKLEVAVGAQKGSLEEMLSLAKTGVENAKDQDATSKEVATAAAAIKQARDQIAKGGKLEERDARYASLVQSTNKQLERLSEELEQAKKLVLFREGPIAAMVRGLNAAEQVTASMGLEAQKKSYETALAKLQACQRDSAEMVEENPRIGSTDFYILGDRTKGKNVSAMCAQHAESLEPKLRAVKGTIAFWDGPAKSFEKARAVLAKGDRNGALSSFESCLETGKILQHKHPSLTKEQFEVAGQKTTLAAIVVECQKQARQLRGTITTAKK